MEPEVKDTKERIYDREEVTELLGSLRALMSLVFFTWEKKKRERKVEKEVSFRERGGDENDKHSTTFAINRKPKADLRLCLLWYLACKPPSNEIHLYKKT